MVAVVILNWNGEKLLKEFLPKVIENTNLEIGKIYVADNGSTDGSLKLLSTEFPEVKVIEFDKNYGFAGGYNHALDEIEDEYTVLLNSDVAPEKGWLDTLLKYMDNHKETGACQPKVLSYTDKTKFEYAGACGGFIDKHGYTYCRGRIFDTCEIDEGQYDDTIKVFWATGAALMVRTELYKEVGGLDEKFFAHMEEIDLCWRILLKGYEIAVVPGSIVYHLGGGSLPASNPKKTYLNFRNNLLMLHKNLPDSTRKKKLFIRRLLDTLAWGKYMATLDIKNANAIIKAHRDFKKMSKEYATHPEIDLLDTRSDTNRNIITGYFLKRKTTWRQLQESAE